MAAYRLRLRLWLIAMWAAAVACLIAETALIVGPWLIVYTTTKPLLGFYLAIGSAVWAILAVATNKAKELRIVAARLAESAAIDSLHQGLRMRHVYVTEMLAEICAERSLPVPGLEFTNNALSGHYDLVSISHSTGRKWLIKMLPGIIDAFTRPDLFAVLAHELRHVSMVSVGIDLYVTLLRTIFVKFVVVTLIPVCAVLLLALMGLQQTVDLRSAIVMFVLIVFSFGLSAAVFPWISNARLRAREYVTDALCVHDLITLKLGGVENLTTVLLEIERVVTGEPINLEAPHRDRLFDRLLDKHPPIVSRVRVLNWIFKPPVSTD